MGAATCSAVMHTGAQGSVHLCDLHPFDCCGPLLSCLDRWRCSPWVCCTAARVLCGLVQASWRGHSQQCSFPSASNVAAKGLLLTQRLKPKCAGVSECVLRGSGDLMLSVCAQSAQEAFMCCCPPFPQDMWLAFCDCKWQVCGLVLSLPCVAYPCGLYDAQRGQIQQGKLPSCPARLPIEPAGLPC